MDDPMVEKYLPMTETAYYILLSLYKPRHGYGIMQHVRNITHGRVKIGPGTIYGTLAKMEQDGLIEAVAEQDRRKIYLICRLGKELLKKEIKRLQELVANGKQETRSEEILD